MVLGNTSYDLEPKVKVKGQIMCFLVNAYPPKQLQSLQVHRSYDAEGTGKHFVLPRLQGQGQIMYFLVNACSPKLLDVATSNFAGA